MNQGKLNNTRTKIFDELMLFFENILVPYLDKRFGGVENRLGGVENRLDKVKNSIQELKTEVMYVKDNVRDLKADSPTVKEFTDHEKRISHLEKVTFPS